VTRAQGFPSATAAVSASLGELPGSVVQLGPTELRSYEGRGFVAGWRLTIQFVNGSRRIDLLVDEWFPRSAPRAALVDRPNFLTWPHVERDGVLCLLPGTAAVDPTNPVGSARVILGAACELIEECIAGSNTDDFRQEFLSYWNWALPEKYEVFYSLLSPAEPTRAIRVWTGKAFALLGESDQDISRWLANRRGEKEVHDSPSGGLFLWLDAALTPAEYPASGNALLALVRRAGGIEILDGLVKESPSRIVIALGAPTSNGPCLAAVSALRPLASSSPRGRSRNPVQDGFRPGKMPAGMLTQRYVAGGQIVRLPVERVDADWILGRNESAHLGRLRAARVVVLGCGSVGAPVALALIQAGVSKITLIDPDSLKWANTTRHPLGASFVGRNKAEALTEYIRQNHPHVDDVSAHPRRWQDVMRTSPDVFSTATLIVSAMGDWEAESGLNEWHVASGRQVPVVYGWTEPFACAGHAVAICREKGCFNCGMSNVGVALSTRTSWNADTVRQEPACGASYQPYGVVALGHIVSAIAEVALAHLAQDVAQSSEAVWSSSDEFLRACGGAWTAAPGTPNSLVRRPWERRPDCPTCA
jgi:molybdopterin/thiamine biosynthesis adenylyltransferase